MKIIHVCQRFTLDKHRFDFMCFLHAVRCDIIPRRALCLLHGHVRLWTGAGTRPPLPICKYDYPNQAVTSDVCHIRLEFPNTNVNLKSDNI